MFSTPDSLVFHFQKLVKQQQASSSSQAPRRSRFDPAPAPIPPPPSYNYGYSSNQAPPQPPQPPAQNGWRQPPHQYQQQQHQPQPPSYSNTNRWWGWRASPILCWLYLLKLISPLPMTLVHLFAPLLTCVPVTFTRVTRSLRRRLNNSMFQFEFISTMRPGATLLGWLLISFVVFIKGNKRIYINQFDPGERWPQ